MYSPQSPINNQKAGNKKPRYSSEAFEVFSFLAYQATSA
jgi:hypothetical protein